MVVHGNRTLTAAQVVVTTIDTITASALPSGATKDATLIDMSHNVQWNRNLSTKPTWAYADPSNNAAANSALIQKTVSTGKSGHVYGLMISSEDPSNNFVLGWTSGSASKSMLIVMNTPGTMMIKENVPLTEGAPADAGTAVNVKNSQAATAGARLQAWMLYGEI